MRAWVALSMILIASGLVARQIANQPVPALASVDSKVLKPADAKGGGAFDRNVVDNRDHHP